MSDREQADSKAESLDRTVVRALVERFYDHVHRDPLLAPVFERTIRAEDWPQHLDQMTEFWSTTLLATASYRGDPVGLHAAIDELTSEHFDRWIELFKLTAEQLLSPELASGLIELARGIRSGLERQVTRRRRPSTTATED